MPLFPNSRLSLESVLGVLSRNSQRESCKVVIYNYIFVDFNSVPNLIVILFNLIYLVFHVGFICKGCVREKESVKTQGILKIEVFSRVARE